MRHKMIEKMNLLIVVFIIGIIGAVIAGMLSNNNSKAVQIAVGAECMSCAQGTLVVSGYEKISLNPDEHIVKIKCSSSLCNFTTEQTQACTKTKTASQLPGATHKVDLICEKCEGQTFQIEECTGATHANGGTCEICSQVYQAHNPTDTVKEYYTTASTHTPLYTCSYSGCDLTHEGIEEEHTGETHDNDGKCTVCGVQYQIHEETTNLVCREGANTGHTPVYRCSVEGCTSTFKGPEEEHTGGTHDNDGKCTVCTWQYQEHGKEDGYGHIDNVQKAGHEIHHFCKYKDNGCEYQYTTGLLAHEGGTHDNDGKCKACRYQYQDHSQSTTIKEYTKAETGHTPVYTCSFEGCESTYTGTETEHTGGTHSNEGKCTECGYQYQAHSQSTTIKEYTKTETGHTPVYKCSFAGCESAYTGQEEQHNYQNGECIKCKAADPNFGGEECSHTYEMKRDNTKHWKQCTKCEQIETGTSETHRYGEFENNNDKHTGTCTVCQYQLTEQHSYQNGECTKCKAEDPNFGGEECSHTYEMKSDNTKHWKQCTKCEQIATGTSETHRYGEFENNNDKHTGTCTVCQYQLTEQHSYQNGECIKCKAEDPNLGGTECSHTYEMKSDSNQHWEECTKCNNIKNGTAKKHQYEKYIDNNDGTHSTTCIICNYTLKEGHLTNCEKCEEEVKPGTDEQDKNDQGKDEAVKDETVKDEKLPYAGENKIIIMSISAFSMMVVISIIKMKKYKGI